MPELWTELLCVKEIGGIKVGTIASVFRNVPKESYVWVYLNDSLYGGYQYKIPKSLLKEHFVCLK